MAFSVPWEWTQLKTEYGFLELPGESAASCQGQSVSARGLRPPDSRGTVRTHPGVQHPVTGYRQGVLGGVRHEGGGKTRTCVLHEFEKKIRMNNADDNNDWFRYLVWFGFKL